MFFRREITAVDIGTSAVKVARIRKKRKKIELIDSCKKMIPVDEVDNENDLVDLLKDIFQTMKYTPKNVTTAVSSRNVIIRNIEFPSMSDKELAQTLKLGAGEYLTFPVENSRLKYLILNKDENKMDIMLAAVKEEILNNYVNIFEKAEIDLEVINVQPMALISLINYQLGLEEPVLIIDIGARGSRIIIGDVSNIYLVRNLEIGGDTFTDLIKARYNINDDKAEKYKKNLRLDEEIAKNEELINREQFTTLENLNTFSDMLDYLVEEIERSQDFFSKKYSNLPLQKILITGGGSGLNGLKTNIMNQLGNGLETIDPLADFSPDRELGPDFSVAVGLAASEVLDNET